MLYLLFGLSISPWGRPPTALLASPLFPPRHGQTRLVQQSLLASYALHAQHLHSNTSSCGAVVSPVLSFLVPAKRHPDVVGCLMPLSSSPPTKPVQFNSAAVRMRSMRRNSVTWVLKERSAGARAIAVIFVI